jgi:hypothetical protein
MGDIASLPLVESALILILKSKLHTKTHFASTKSSQKEKDRW